MKKLIILSAFVFASTAMYAQDKDKDKSRIAAPATTIQPAGDVQVQSPPKQDDNKIAASHWNAARHQLESAKQHLEKVKFDPGVERENAMRSIDAALAEVKKALVKYGTTQPVKPHEGHDNSDQKDMH